MATYVIVEMEIIDPVEIEDYRKLAGASITAHGGQFIIRGGKAEALEGGWKPNRIVVVEFPTAAQARQWWASKEYAAARIIRERAAKTRMIMVEGVA